MRLLVVNLNYLGDALFTTPALAVLKTRFPDASIDVLAGARAAAILKDNPYIDRIMLRPPHGGVGRAAALAKTLRKGAYHGVFLFQSTLSNAALAWLARVPVRVGFANEGCAPFLTHVVPCQALGEHVVDAYVRLANAWDGGAAQFASAPTTVARLSVAVSRDDRDFAEQFFETGELAPPVVGLVIGATRPQKRWPEEYFARLADKLWNVAGMSCVLLGGPEEADAAQRILTLADSPLVSAVGKTSEMQLAALVAKLGVVVSGDTGPLHIATAMDTPVVALFGSTDPADTGPWRSPSAPEAVVLYDALHCAPCRKNPTCGGAYDCLRALTPERVFDAVCGLLHHPAKRVSLPMLPGVPALLGSGVSLDGLRGLSGIDKPAQPAARRKTALPVRSVLVLTKHRFMGDAIVAVPLLRAIREVWPEARLTLVTGDQAATVLRNCPYTDKILAYDKESAKRTAAGSAHLTGILVKKMVGLLRTDRPDLCLVADRSFRAAVAAALAGGRTRAGFDSEGRGRILTHPVEYDLDLHEAECCLDILRAVRPEEPGEPRYDPRPILWPTTSEMHRGAELLREHGAGFAPQILIGVQPGASHDYKQWRAERFAEVAQELAEETGAAIVLLGKGVEEVEASRRMREAMSATVPVIDLTNRTTLRETMGVLTQLSLFIGNDTGVNHIAAAVGTPTIALFGPTPAQKWGNRGPVNLVFAAAEGDMDRIPVRTVLDAARPLLQSLLVQDERVGHAGLALGEKL